MSEFRQASAHVDALETSLATLEDAISASSPGDIVDESLRFILVSKGIRIYSFYRSPQAAIDGEVDAVMEKFRARCSMVDPVTKQPRFGPKMLAKVQDMLHRYDQVKAAVDEETPLRLQAGEIINQLLQRKIRAEKEQEAEESKALKAQIAVERARGEEQERLQQETQAREAELQRQEQIRIQELAVAANKKRAKREHERVEQERQQKQQEDERELLNASIPLGREGLERAIEMLHESTGNKALFRQSLEKLLVVVTNICSSPENTAYRHIPKDNPNFHADLGQYTGGHQCLLALGFRELQQGDEAQSRAVFVLEEPDLSEDIDAWSDWFDGLKEMKDLVESKL